MAMDSFNKTKGNKIYGILLDDPLFLRFSNRYRISPFMGYPCLSPFLSPIFYFVSTLYRQLSISRLLGLALQSLCTFSRDSAYFSLCFVIMQHPGGLQDLLRFFSCSSAYFLSQGLSCKWLQSGHSLLLHFPGSSSCGMELSVHISSFLSPSSRLSA